MNTSVREHSVEIELFGLSHHTAPIEVLERCAFTPQHSERALALIREELGTGDHFEAAILSTCNRVELYVAWPDRHAGLEDVVRFLTRMHGRQPEELAFHLANLRGEAAARHLCTVAAGLESLFVGEAQILGQVREAYQIAQGQGTAGPVLSALFRHAIETGKRVHSETSISRYATSVSEAAVEMAARSLAGRLSGCEVLIVGAGKAGVIAARSLANRGTRQITVINRSYERAAALAARCGGRAETMERLPQALDRADVVISCTNAPGQVISAGDVRRAMAGRSGRPLLLVDIAVPLDVDPASGEVPGVRLINLEHMRSTTETSLGLREEDCQHATAIVAEQTRAFMAWLQERQVAPVIAGLRERAESIRQQEMVRQRGRLAGLSDEQRDDVALLTHRIIQRLLHDPTVCLKAMACQGQGPLYAEAAQALFGLDGDAQDSGG